MCIRDSPGVVSDVEQVGSGRAPEMFVTAFGMAGPTGDHRRDARAQAGAVLVVGARIVVLVVGHELCVGEPVLQQVVQHQHVRLFQGLGLVGLLQAEDRLDRLGPPRVAQQCEIGIGAREVAGELLDRPAREWCGHMHPVGDRGPLGHAVVGEVPVSYTHLDVYKRQVQGL